MSAVPESNLNGWQAELGLRFAVPRAQTRTRLVERSHRGPLVIQRAFYPEGDPCHVYIVHPPGGVVGGDELRIDVRVDGGAHALITTPAATKFYRCGSRGSSQQQELRAAGATLEWLPQENIFYRGADAHTATRIHIDRASRFIGWEIGCLGLPARGEPFERGSLRLDLELWNATAAAPIYIDRLRLSGQSPARHAPWGLAGCEALGTLLATPAGAPQVDALRELLAARPRAMVTLVDGVLVLRAFERQAESIRKLFIQAWHLLRLQVVGHEAVPPRIWNT
jgi:urease accessory protein